MYVEGTYEGHEAEWIFGFLFLGLAHYKAVSDSISLTALKIDRANLYIWPVLSKPSRIMYLVNIILRFYKV